MCGWARRCLTCCATWMVFNHSRRAADSPPRAGDRVVAMRRNLSDLPALLRLARDWARSASWSPMCCPTPKRCCLTSCIPRALSNDSDLVLPDIPGLSLPRFDADPAITTVLDAAQAVGWSGSPNGTQPGERGAPPRNWCPFIEAGRWRWVGWRRESVPAAAAHQPDYLHGYRRTSRRHVMARLETRGLLDIWHDPAYRTFRQRVRDFDFAPCTICDGCPISDTNETDCYGSDTPSCGGCLWAQGIVAVPVRG